MATKVYLSHKKFRALIKKNKRKLKRQAAAKERDGLLVQVSPGHEEYEAQREREEAFQFEAQERERLRRHQEWLQRELEAQQIFEKKIQQELEAQRRRDEEALRMQKELEEKNHQLEEAKLKEEKARQDKENKLKEIVDQLPEGDEPWHNPIAPQDYQEREVCGFFTKTGACRFGDRCSRLHPRPLTSTTLLLRGLYHHISLEHSLDNQLECDDSELRQHFRDFYQDVLPEFRAVGRLLQFKVCCNSEPHLRGNVYVQFASEEEAQQGFILFNGRFYAGRQISCQFVTIERWKAAICGQFHRSRCPKGKNCNFLHVFRNPHNEFWEADQDMLVGGEQRRSRSQDDDGRSRKRSHSRSRHRENSIRNGTPRLRRYRSRSPDRHRHRKPSRSQSREKDIHPTRKSRSHSRDRDESYNRSMEKDSGNSHHSRKSCSKDREHNGRKHPSHSKRKSRSRERANRSPRIHSRDRTSSYKKKHSMRKHSSLPENNKREEFDPR